MLMIKVGAVLNKDYYIKGQDDEWFFEKRGAAVLFKGKQIGKLGILHPEVLSNFEIKYPVSCLEIALGPLFDHFREGQK